MAIIWQHDACKHAVCILWWFILILQPVIFGREMWQQGVRLNWNIRRSLGFQDIREGVAIKRVDITEFRVYSEEEEEKKSMHKIWVQSVGTLILFARTRFGSKTILQCFLHWMTHKEFHSPPGEDCFSEWVWVRKNKVELHIYLPTKMSPSTFSLRLARLGFSGDLERVATTKPCAFANLGPHFDQFWVKCVNADML